MSLCHCVHCVRLRELQRVFRRLCGRLPTPRENNRVEQHSSVGQSGTQQDRAESRQKDRGKQAGCTRGWDWLTQSDRGRGTSSCLGLSKSLVLQLHLLSQVILHHPRPHYPTSKLDVLNPATLEGVQPTTWMTDSIYDAYRDTCCQSVGLLVGR